MTGIMPKGHGAAIRRTNETNAHRQVAPKYRRTCQYHNRMDNESNDKAQVGVVPVKMQQVNSICAVPSRPPCVRLCLCPACHVSALPIYICLSKYLDSIITTQHLTTSTCRAVGLPICVCMCVVCACKRVCTYSAQKRRRVRYKGNPEY